MTTQAARSPYNTLTAQEPLVLTYLVIGGPFFYTPDAPGYYGNAHELRPIAYHIAMTMREDPAWYRWRIRFVLHWYDRAIMRYHTVNGEMVDNRFDARNCLYALQDQEAILTVTLGPSRLDGRKIIKPNGARVTPLGKRYVRRTISRDKRQLALVP